MTIVTEVSGLKDLARWAFGPRGLPNLKLLAYGDFSYDGRYRGQCFLLCRSDTSNENADGFRPVRENDYALRDGIIKQYEDLLGVCPAELILEDNIY